MKKKSIIDINKLISITLIIFMLVPSSISVIPISIFKIITIIVVIIFICLFFKRKDDMKRIVKNKFIIGNLIFSTVIFFSLIANYRTIHFNDFYEIAKYIIFAMITICIMTICQEKKYFIFLLKSISIVMIIIGIFGVIQYFNPFSVNELYIQSYAPTQYETLINNYPNPRIVGVKSNPAVYGLLVSLGVYFNLLYFKHAKHKSSCFISIALCVINLMMTLTRTIQIAFICSIIIYILIFVWRKKGWKKAVLAMFATLFTMLILLCVLPDSLTWRLTQILDLSDTTSWIGRTEKWKNYLEIVKQNPLLGIGPVKNHVEKLGYIDGELIQNTLQYGLIGLIAYLGMVFSPLWIYLKKKTNRNILKYYIPILVLVLINNIASSSIILFDTAIGIYIMVGLILIEPIVDNKNKEGVFKI